MGGLLPVGAWLLNRRWPGRVWQYVNFPVLLTGISYAPPATGINYTSFALTGFLFRELPALFALRQRY